MPKGAPAGVEKLGYEIVRGEELSRGWQPEPQLSQRRQSIQGCDFFSTPPDGGTPHPVEVKGWDEPLRKPNGDPTYPADLRIAQLERAKRDPNCRLEIVANLTAVAAGTGEPERVTMTAADVVARAQPWMFKVPLGES